MAVLEVLAANKIATTVGVAGILGGGGLAATQMDGGVPVPEQLFDTCAAPAVVYEVQSGDSLWAISDMASTSIGAVISLNEISEHSVIHSGQDICLPGVTDELASDADVDDTVLYGTEQDCLPYDSILAKIGNGDNAFDAAEIELVQRALVNAGADIPVDGDYGPMTKDAVRAFQAENDMEVDCEIGGQTWNGTDSHDGLSSYVDPLEGQTPGPVGGATTAGEGGVSVAFVQGRLNERLGDYGYPAMAIDGDEGPVTKRAECAALELTGRNEHRNGLNTDDREHVSVTEFTLPEELRGLGGNVIGVSETCQVEYVVQNGDLKFIFPVSTSKENDTPNGTHTSYAYRPGWHVSSLSPEGTQPNMDNSLYFAISGQGNGIAVHGSNNVPTYPASSDCVRVKPADHNRVVDLFGLPHEGSYRSYNGVTVKVWGDYFNG